MHDRPRFMSATRSSRSDSHLASSEGDALSLAPMTVADIVRLETPDSKFDDLLQLLRIADTHQLDSAKRLYDPQKNPITPRSTASLANMGSFAKVITLSPRRPTQPTDAELAAHPQSNAQEVELSDNDLFRLCTDYFHATSPRLSFLGTARTHDDGCGLARRNFDLDVFSDTPTVDRSTLLDASVQTFTRQSLSSKIHDNAAASSDSHKECLEFTSVSCFSIRCACTFTHITPRTVTRLLGILET